MINTNYTIDQFRLNPFQLYTCCCYCLIIFFFHSSESLNCTKKSEHILPGCQTAGQFEHQVNQFLRSLWNKYLGNEEVDALISRLTTNIIIFHTYDDDDDIQ